MRSLPAIAVVLVFAICSITLVGEPAKPVAATPAPVPRPDHPIDIIAPLIGGEWSIDGHWADGSPLRARFTAEWGLEGKFIVARTYVRKEDGSKYQRYLDVYGEKDGHLTAHHFTYNGDTRTSTYDVDGLSYSEVWSPPAGGDAQFKQHVDLSRPNHMHWQVWSRPDKSADWKPMIDGEWQRTTQPPK